MKVFKTDTFGDFIKRMEAKDLEISSEVYSKITKAYKRNYKKVKVFIVTLDNGDQFDFEIKRDEWSKALNACIDIFAENDMFEECIEIKTLLEQLK